MGSRSFVSVQDPAPASLESVSRSPSKLAGLQEDRLEYYKDLRTARFQSHLCNLNRRFQEVVKQPLAFYEEVYQKGDLSPPKLDRLAREIEAAFNGRFPGHPLPPEFHQHQILVNYSIARVGSNVLLIVRLLMEEVKQENGPVIPRYRSTPVVMYHYPNEYFDMGSTTALDDNESISDLDSTAKTDHVDSSAGTSIANSVSSSDQFAYTAAPNTEASDWLTVKSKL